MRRVLRVLFNTRVFVREGGVYKKVREYAREEDDQGTHNLRFTPWMTIVVVFYATIKNVLDSSTGFRSETRARTARCFSTLSRG